MTPSAALHWDKMVAKLYCLVCPVALALNRIRIIFASVRTAQVSIGVSMSDPEGPLSPYYHTFELLIVAAFVLELIAKILAEGKRPWVRFSPLKELG